MSMHEIEGLIEDSVLLLNDSDKSIQEKRELFFHLYNFQAMFDTGYTHFRVKDILVENQFLMSIALLDHPAYKDNKEKITELEQTIVGSKSKWLDDAICIPDESNELAVYFDYGSKLWQELVDQNTIKDKASRPDPLFISDLVNVMMHESTQQKNDLLAIQWYVMISNCYAEEYVEKTEYKSFSSFIETQKVIECKNLVLRTDIKNYNERDGYLTKQAWQDEKDLSSAESLDKQFILRFWLDLDISKDELIIDYEKELLAEKQLNKNGNKQKKIDFITDELSQFLNEENDWVKVPNDNFISDDNDNKTHWLWYKDSSDINGSKFKLDGFDDDYYRQLIKVEFDEGDKSIYCNVGLQFGKILRWQKQQPDADPAFWHFRSNLFTNFDYENSDNNKWVNYLGLWSYPLGASNKKLKESISLFADYLKQENQNITQFALKEFNQKLFKRDCDELMDVIDNGEPGTDGVIPDYAIFDLAAMMPLLFVFNAIDQVPVGEDIKCNENVERYFDTFKKAVSELHPKGASKLYLDTKCDLDTLLVEGMPAVIQLEFILYYRKQLDAQNA